MDSCSLTLAVIHLYIVMKTFKFLLKSILLCLKHASAPENTFYDIQVLVILSLALLDLFTINDVIF